MSEEEQKALALNVLKQFRIIYGAMRQHFRAVEARCAASGSQMWILQEVAASAGIGVGEVARRLSVHQSTASQLVEKLVVRGLVERRKTDADLRRVGLYSTDAGRALLESLPGPASGVLPEALAALPLPVLKTLEINLDALLEHLDGAEDDFGDIPLAEMVKDEGR
ncbi:MAG: hypothetical protein RIR00_86 [Pseudomonadota bacterium]|jgi:DNA-binding MarR family transcriptional regulator